jgi:endonuclease/exonuclease/phosphatase family metal-dependent hydrolase
MTRRLRLATYNVEWFTELFDDDGAFLNDDSLSVRYNVSRAQQFAAIGAVLAALDADAVMIIEGPDQSETRSAARALENFAAHFKLRARRALVGFTSNTRQEIVLIYDPEVMSVQHDPMGDADKSSAAPRFDFEYLYDLNGDGVDENIGFSKPPLEVLAQIHGGPDLRLIGVHTKSKAPRGTRDEAEFVAQSIQNRRKQLAECFWLRGRVAQILAQDTPLIVMGDFNDGPGLDEYERQFGYSSVEVVMGAASPDQPQLFDPHAAKTTAPWGDTLPTTSRFYLPELKDYFEALLDFIMVSPLITQSAPNWRIWHPLLDAAIAANPALAAALLAASDHFPVSIDINLPLAPPPP